MRFVWRLGEVYLERPREKTRGAQKTAFLGKMKDRQRRTKLSLKGESATNFAVCLGLAVS